MNTQGGAARLPSFVVFSDDWGEHPSSCQHIFRHLAKTHPVVWVNTIGMRQPTATLSDLRKGWQKVARMLSTTRRRAPSKAPGNVILCQPWMLPAGGSSVLRKLNAWSVTRTVRELVARKGLSSPIVVSTVPNFGEYPELLQGSTVVYYCVDDFAQWPGLDAELVRDMERRLIDRADVLVATSSKLYDRLVAFKKPTYLLTHGVDVEMFSSEADREHAFLTGISRPRAGFFGLIDGRLDQELVAAVARRMPELSFVLTGPVDCPVDRLAACKNVHLTGPVRYVELPSLITGLDVLFIPYATGEFADTLAPLKLKEYLATGRPIVSTPIAATREFRDHLSIAGSEEEWVAALRRAVGANTEQRRAVILPSLEAESWARKGEILLDICVRHESCRSARSADVLAAFPGR